MIPHKGFIAIDIPEPCRSKVQAIRDDLKTLTAKLPVEITLAGSSGVGPIPEGTDIALICAEVDRIAASTSTFRMEFANVFHFPDTGVFFTPPKDRRPFDTLHNSLAASRIPFARSPFPYSPHCTLRVGPKVEPSLAERIYSLPVPSGEIMLDSISVYALNPRTFVAALVHRVKLGLPVRS
jgi:2'-5' RNA ligase